MLPTPLPALIPTGGTSFVPPPPPVTSLQIPTWQITAAFGFGPLDPTPVFTDITNWSRQFDAEIGRQHELDRMEPGRLELVLEDRFGYYTPGNTLSPFYNLLTPGDSLGIAPANFGTWTVGNGAYATQSSEVLWGSLGGQITSTGSTPGSALTAGGQAGYLVSGSTQYTATAQFRAFTTGEVVGVIIQWYNGAGTFISQSVGGGVTDNNAGWTMASVTAISPANAGFAQIVVISTTHSGNTHFFTCVGLFFNPTGLPVVWNYGQAAPFLPGTPIQIQGTWAGHGPTPIYYGFADAWEPTLTDVMNQDTTVNAYDALALLGLAPMCNVKYFPSVVEATNPIHYWRLGDPAGSQSAVNEIPLQTSLHTNFGTLGQNPAFGQQDITGAGVSALQESSFTGSGAGALLYDSATAVSFHTTGTLAANANSYLYAPANSIFSAPHAWSLNMLVNFGTNTETGVALLAVYNGAGGNLFLDTSSAGVLEFAGNGVGAPISGGPNVCDGKWHMITVMVSAGGVGANLYVFVDTVLAIATTTTRDVTPISGGPTANGAFDLCETASNTAASADTAIQDLSFYNYAPLTGPQMSSLFTAFKLLQNVEYTGQRLEACMLIAGMTAYPHNFDTGTVLCSAETTSQTSTAALSYMQNVVDTEMGFFFSDPSGFIEFHDARFVSQNALGSSSQATMGDSMSGAVNMYYEPKGLKIPQDSLDYWTVIQVQAMQTQGAGALQEIDLAASIGPPGGYGRRPLQRTNMIFFTDLQAKQMAEKLAGRYGTPKKRVDNVMFTGRAFSPFSGPGINIRKMLELGMWNRVTFQRQGAGESQFSQDMLIEKIHHKFDGNVGDYQVEYVLSPYEVPQPSMAQARAYLATPSSIGTGWSKIPLNGVSFDPNGMVDPIANSRIIPCIRGLYQVNGVVQYVTTNNPQTAGVGLYFNGSIYAQGDTTTKRTAVALDVFAYHVSDLIFFNGFTDYVELWGYNGGGTAIAIAPLYPPYTYLSLRLVSS